MATGFAGSTTPVELRNGWRTPPFLYNAYDRIYKFTGDVAASAENALHPRFLTLDDNAPERLWGDFGGYVWCNPPYDNIYPWVYGAEQSCAMGTGTVMIVPSDQANGWFEAALESVHDIDWITGTRVGFLHPETGKVNTENMRGSVVFIWHPNQKQTDIITRYISYSVIAKQELLQRNLYECRCL